MKKVRYESSFSSPFSMSKYGNALVTVSSIRSVKVSILNWFLMSSNNSKVNKFVNFSE